MKKLTRKQELQLLDECANNGRCDKLVQYYWKTICFTVQKAFMLSECRFDQADIEELRNEVFLQLFKNKSRRLRQYKEDMGLSLGNWIRMIASQTVTMHLRKKDPMGLSGQNRRISLDRLKAEFKSKNNEGGSSQPGRTSSQTAEDMENLIKRLESRRMLEQVLENVKKLSSRDQLVFKLYFFEKLSYKEIASYMNEEIGNIYTIKSRIITRLKKLMSEI